MISPTSLLFQKLTDEMSISIRDVEVGRFPLSGLPARTRSLLSEIESLVLLALNNGETRYCIEVQDNQVTQVSLHDSPILISAPMVSVTLADRKVAAVSGVHTILSPEGECIATTQPGLLCQLLAAVGIDTAVLQDSLQALPPDKPGPVFLVVVRLDETALLLKEAGYDVSQLLAYISATNWQSPGRCGPEHFTTQFAGQLEGWEDKWRTL